MSYGRNLDGSQKVFHFVRGGGEVDAMGDVTLVRQWSRRPTVQWLLFKREACEAGTSLNISLTWSLNLSAM